MISRYRRANASWFHRTVLLRACVSKYRTRERERGQCMCWQAYWIEHRVESRHHCCVPRHTHTCVLLPVLTAPNPQHMAAHSSCSTSQIPPRAPFARRVHCRGVWLEAAWRNCRPLPLLQSRPGYRRACLARGRSRLDCLFARRSCSQATTPYQIYLDGATCSRACTCRFGAPRTARYLLATAVPMRQLALESK